ncbi:Glycosyl transferases involved in cell wall biogenesis [Streptococcus infantarius subsp. infantarius]|nr:Glycosyl transferases involved in cell wall biogenesis [Streptococcus infantarius subsp. infantarius]
MNNHKVSIVIPVYNSEEYLEKCIDSVFKQSYKNIELVIVNDGSTDNCKRIIDDYAVENPLKIRAIHIENSGVSNARNVGMQESSGSLLMFLDADDYISSSYVEELALSFNTEYEKNCMAVGNFSLIYTGGWKKNEKITSTFFEENCCAKELLNDLADSPGGGYVWNKMFRRDLIFKSNLLFDSNIALMEDFLFCAQYLDMYAEYNVGICDDFGYFYVQRETSIVHKNKRDKSKIVMLEKILIISKNYKKLYLSMQDEYANHLVSVSFFDSNLSRKYFIEVYKKIRRHSSIKYLTFKHKCMLLLGCIIPEIIPILRSYSV